MIKENNFNLFVAVVPAVVLVVVAWPSEDIFPVKQE